MLAAMSGRSILGFRIEPRSPPVQVATWTSTPCATYIAVLAAPLLDSSSGWAWTCMRRRPSPGRASTGCEDMVASLGVALPRATMRDVEQVLTERYAAPPAWRRPLTVVAGGVGAVGALAWLAWAAFDPATPKGGSNLLGWGVVDAHTPAARVDVPNHHPPSHPTCARR